MSQKSGKDILQDLNNEQQAAVTQGDGPLLIVAGAGTGKTTVITRRIAWLIEQGLAKPEEILALTFTDKAAQEMEERVDRLLPMGYVNVWVSTFHSFGERVLQDWGLEIGLPTNFRVLTVAEQWMMVRNNLSKFNLDYYRPLGNPTRFIHALLTHFSRAKDEAVYPAEYLKAVEAKRLNSGAVEYIRKPHPMGSHPKGEKVKNRKAKLKKQDLPAGEVDMEESEVARLSEVAEAYTIYQNLLHEAGVLDFGDLINYTLKLFQERPRVLGHYHQQFKYILVDEFQDTNYAQYELLKILAQPANNITVVGDDDQSIYKFRGASISNILEFKHDYPQAREVFLTTNYRSYQNILDSAYEFIQLNNPNRLEVKLAGKGRSLSKKLIGQRQGQGIVEHVLYNNVQDEARGVVEKIIELQKKNKVDWNDFAILVRANSQAAPFLQALRQAQLPHTYVANRGLYQEEIVISLISYLKLLDNYHESGALYRVLTDEPFSLGQDDLAKLSYQANKHTISLYEALKQATTIGVSTAGFTQINKLLELIEKHTAVARQHSAAELYVMIVNDLGINERLQHPAAVRDAQFLTAFYQRVQRYETDSSDRTLAGFMRYLALELESGEEGELPPDTEEGPETVKVVTVHSAKGLEWRYVFMVQLVDKRFPSVERREAIELPIELIKETLPEGDIHLQEERRLFYVGLTRARDGLFLTRAHDYFGKTTKRPSRFLFEMGLVSEAEMSAPAGKLKVVPQLIAKSPASFNVPDSFSFSSVSAFKKCPLEFKYRYLLKLPAPGSASLSFGSTIHKTLEIYLRRWQQRLGITQGDLFGSKSHKPQLPSLAELKQIFGESWIDEWYESVEQKKDYREKRGPEQLDNFFKEISQHPPRPKYLESFFKIGFGPYKFVGKIDRMDEVSGGVEIIDYKTGAEPAKGLEKVDRDQLIIYQIAAEEFFRQQAVSARYWYLQPNSFSPDFVADQKQQAVLKVEYQEKIAIIVKTIENNTFVVAHEDAPKHDCHYVKLGLA